MELCTGDWKLIYIKVTPKIMRTAISIPDRIFQSAEILAHQLKISRSELFTKAMSEYLEAHKCQDVTESLNQVYANFSSKLDKELALMQLNSVEQEDW